MNMPNGLRYFKISFCLVFFAVLLVFNPAARAQDPTQYTPEEYKAYQDITAEADIAKKAPLIMKFLQDYPKSALNPHIEAAYQQLLADLQKAQRWTQMISLGEQYLKKDPGDTYTISVLAGAYQRTNNNKQFVAFGERAYEKKADGNLAYYLAKAYKAMGDDAKFLAWAEKTVTLLPDNHEMLVELATGNARMARTPQAAKYSKLAIKVLTSTTKPEGTDETAWKNYVNGALAGCYAIVGNAAYETKDYATAISNLENSAKLNKRNGMVYYFLGMSYWQTNKIDVAMLDLAKAYLLGGPSAAPAKQHLDNLYKSSHANSLAGQERVINRAKEDLK
jgi:tetratricopeptide (TPR) repeat protein